MTLFTWGDYANQYIQFIKQNQRPPLYMYSKYEYKLYSWFRTELRNHIDLTGVTQDNRFAKLFNKVYKTYADNVKCIVKSIKKGINILKTSTNLLLLRPAYKWFQTLQNQYKNKTGIMIIETVYTAWKSEILKFNLYSWDLYMVIYENFLDSNNRKPKIKAKNNEEPRLVSWFLSAKYEYEQKINLMKKKRYQTKWKKFMQKYQHILI